MKETANQSKHICISLNQPIAYVIEKYNNRPRYIIKNPVQKVINKIIVPKYGEKSYLTCLLTNANTPYNTTNIQIYEYTNIAYQRNSQSINQSKHVCISANSQYVIKKIIIRLGI